MNLFSDRDKLVSCFPVTPWQVVETRGTREGLILKFRTLYMKIYNSYTEYSYLIEIYNYGINNPVRTDIVNVNGMREYAHNLKKYLL